jgi:hypothetical protein
MSKSLDEVKQEISQKYLGKSGIHGVGLRRKENALYIYTENKSNAAQTALLEKIRKEAAPFSVVTVEEGRSKIN